LVPFLQAHPVTAMWGVGPKTFERLQRLGVSTIGDLAAVGEAALVAALGVASGQHLHRLALGVDDREVVADRRAKSIGHEETFSQDRHGRAELHGDLVRLTESVAARLRSHSVAARTVSIKVRFGDFTTITRSITVSEPVDTGPDLLRSAGGLLDHVELSSGVRLLGVSGSQLVTAARQLSLDDLDGGWGGATDAIDEIRRRFGSTSIGPARLQADRPTGESTGRARPGLWGPERSD
jgi:DNA polymerase-4